jgi:transcriptional regulator with XRE-family HTH domain
VKTVEDLNDDDIDAFHRQIGRNVKKYRELRGYSQLALSQALGHKSVGLVSQAELYLKKQHFNLEHLYKIAYILDCSVESLIENNQDKAGE